MKIVQINYAYGTGSSTGRSTMELHEYLLKKGVHSWVFANDILGYTSEKKNVYLFGKKAEQDIHAVMSRITGLQGYFSYFTTKIIVKKLRKIKADIVLLGVLHSNCICFPLLIQYLSENNIPTVLVLHDCWYFTGHCCYFSQVNCERWKCGCGKCPSRKDWNKSWFFDTSAKMLSVKADWFSRISRLAVVGVSDWITEEARQSVLKNAQKICRIYNWIDTDIFCIKDTSALRKHLGLSEKTKILLGVAVHWSEWKGLQVIIMAAETYPQVKIILIGELPQNIKYPENIIRTGSIYDMGLLAEYYSVADVFLNPSVQETFGKTTAEALCCGTPVIAYQTTACIELVENNCGALVSLGNKMEFVEKIKVILEKGKKYYMEHCREFAVKNFSRDARQHDYLKLFYSLNDKSEK